MAVASDLFTKAFDFSVEADAQDGGKSCKPIPDEFLNALAGASGEGELPGSASRCAPVAYSAEGARRRWRRKKALER